MPHAIDRDHDLRDKGLVSVFLESQGTAADALPGFMWAHWPGFDARVAPNTQLPLPESKGLPHGALIGVDGTLLWDGSPSAGEKVVKEKLEAELVKVQKGWGDTADARKMRALLYGKGSLAEARKVVDAVADAAQQAELRKELDAVYARRSAAVKAAQDDARWVEARELALALQKSTAGVADWQQAVTALLATFDTPEARKELAADEKLQKFARSLRDGKAKANQQQLPALLAKIAKDAAGTKVGEHLQQLISGIKTTARD